jgi:predicted metalloprotease
MRLLGVLAVAFALLLAGCASWTGGSGSSPATQSTASAPAATAPAPSQTSAAAARCGGSLEGCFSYAEMDDYLDAIVPMVAQFFETAYPDVAGPRDIVYIPHGRAAASCGGYSDSMAYEYCTANQTIYVGQDLLWSFYRQAGDAAPAIGLAHEWGHHLQYMLNVPLARTASQSIKFENQADCISGAWARYADEQGWLETDDDIADIEVLLEAIGSSESSARDHGTPSERADAFYRAYEKGIEACNAYFPASPIA